jgi:hypothetical protein
MSLSEQQHALKNEKNAQNILVEKPVRKST